MDLGTGLALLGTKDLVSKILGPTAEYIGEGIKTWTEKRVNNVRRIFANAAKKLGDRIDSDGQVPPRILRGILEEGSVTDDPLAADYFGGVLASSRTSIGRDDRGATIISLLSRLSAYQIRTHYVLYSVIRDMYLGGSYQFDALEERTNFLLLFLSLFTATPWRFQKSKHP